MIWQRLDSGAGVGSSPRNRRATKALPQRIFSAPAGRRPAGPEFGACAKHIGPSFRESRGTRATALRLQPDGPQQKGREQDLRATRPDPNLRRRKVLLAERGHWPEDF